jgi:hypothetical protein
VNSDGLLEWMPCKINGYDQGVGKFTGHWIDDNTDCKLNRISLLFDVEEPRKFAQRVR